MKRWVAVLALIPSLLRADITQRLNVRTQDGTVNTYPYSARFTNGTLTDNGDGTVSIAITGGGGTWGSITGTLSSQTDLWTQFTAVATSTAAIYTQFGNVATSTAALWTQFGAVATSTGAIYTQFGAIATSTGAIYTQFGAVATSTGTIITRANLAAAATAQVAIDTTTLNTRANLVAAATAQVAIDTTAVNGKIEPIYPSTGMPTFPFGIVTSSINASSNTVIAGSTFYQNGPILLISSVTLSGSAGFSSTSLYGIVGSILADNAATGNVGEYVVSTVGATSVPTANNYGDLTSISLTAGDWNVVGSIIYVRNGAAVSGLEAGVSTTAGNSTSGLITAQNWIWLYSTDTTFTYVTLTIPVSRLSLSTTTTVYLKDYINTYSVATPKAYGSISARRIR